MSLALDAFLILLPFIIGIGLLVKWKVKADLVGTTVFVLIFIIAIFQFKTNWQIAFLSSIAGIIKSFPISLMVLTSILMITYMEKTGALAKIIVSFKKIGGGNEAFQIMIINLALGTFLVSIGATPVTMLPPIMIAMGYSAFASVALPSIGYDPLCTYALLAVPASFFADFMGISDQASGLAFSYYMPLVTTGIALGMLFLAGGKKLLFSKDGIIFSLVGGISTGVIAICSNLIAYYFDLPGFVYLTGVIAGLICAIFLIVVALIKKIKIIDSSVLSTEERKIDETMSLWRALSPWLFLIFFVIITNLILPSIPAVAQFMNEKLAMIVRIGEIEISLAILSKAYFWVLISVLCSVPFLGWKKKEIKETLNVWGKRSIRPVYSAAIFFAVAYIIIYSGFNVSSFGWIKIDENNMVNILAMVSAYLFGNFYPLIVPFVGMFGGFISGSETSSIAMFTNYHQQTAVTLGISALAVGTANGVGGGLASVLSPAKIQNAAAVIDKVGIEGDVIRKTAPIAILMTLSVAAVCLCWANNYIWWQWFIVFGIFIVIIGSILIPLFLSKKRLEKNGESS